MLEIPLGLRHALESGECVLFLGAGIGEHLLDKEGKSAPDGEALAKELAEYFSIETGGEYYLPKVAEVVEINKNRSALDTFLHKRLNGLEPDKLLQWLFSLRWKAIYTTNYDASIKRAYDLNPKPPQKPVIITSTSELRHYDLRFDVPVYYLHGYLYGSGKPQIVITETDYSRFRETRHMLFELLKLDFATSCILYIGYRNQDPNWSLLLKEMAEDFYPSPLPHSYRVAPQTSLLDIQILKARGVETINTSFKEFAETAASTVSMKVIEEDQLREMRSGIPTELLSFFDKNPVSLTRLLSSWTYVNQAPFDGTPNIPAFMKGDRPNWALVGSRQHFERDIEETLYDNMIDYATSTGDKPKASVILGSAGYGTSTLLMSLASKLVKERAGAVFMLKPGHPLIEGDVEFALSLFPGMRPFFFVDNARRYCNTLSTLMHHLQDTGRPAMFVLGERLNEWRQEYQPVSGDEFQIEALSDPEITRLLDFLGRHHALNKLEGLTQDVQFATIKKLYNKELLVAMREATEGESFDAIIESEFRGIGNDIARKMYLFVCCFSQHGAYLRDSLLASLLNIGITELYEKTKKFAEGVVVFDCVDEIRQRYAARARHRIIASVVWERCTQEFDKDAIIQISLSALNLNYGIDETAFEQFVRSDRLIDVISTLDAKIKFFDTACQKDPRSPYVRQHYARMLSRADKAELALLQIDDAIKINPRIRVLYHTRGMILSQLALSSDNLEVGRRRLAQSEASFKQGLSFSIRDEYCYQGLARLYFSWAKRPSLSSDESAEYISKAEGIISEGLKKVNVRDSLWIESAGIQEWLGHRPESIKALEKAVEDSPGSIIARYLLGRTYRNEGRYPKALQILDPVIKHHHEEFRSFIEYALNLVCLKKPYLEAIAILKLSTLYGLSDPRFRATYAGMLFMNNQFQEAEVIFTGSSECNFTWPELNTIQFWPPDPENPQNSIRLKGKVVTVQKGHALVEVPGMPRFLCPGSKFYGLVMKEGLNITFEPGFSPRNRIADKPLTL